MTYLGVEHGTRAVRFAALEPVRTWEIPRERAARLAPRPLRRALEEGLGLSLDAVRLAAVAYGMGDSFSSIRPLGSLRGRGILGPAGPRTGGGARVFDLLLDSGLPAVAVPGLHRGTLREPAFRFYSHGAAADKVGSARAVAEVAGRDFLLADVGGAAAFVAVSRGRVAGALDATLLAPGMLLGPLDLEALRSRRSPMASFSRGGAVPRFGLRGPAEFLRGRSARAREARRAVALHTALGLGALGSLFGGPLYVAGEAGEAVRPQVERWLGRPVRSAGPLAPARGLALLARDVARGRREVLGVPVAPGCRRLVRRGSALGRPRGTSPDELPGVGQHRPCGTGRTDVFDIR